MTRAFPTKDLSDYEDCSEEELPNLDFTSDDYINLKIDRAATLLKRTIGKSRPGRKPLNREEDGAHDFASGLNLSRTQGMADTDCERCPEAERNRWKAVRTHSLRAIDRLSRMVDDDPGLSEKMRKHLHEDNLADLMDDQALLQSHDSSNVFEQPSLSTTLDSIPETPNNRQGHLQASRARAADYEEDAPLEVRALSVLPSARSNSNSNSFSSA